MNQPRRKVAAKSKDDVRLRSFKNVKLLIEVNKKRVCSSDDGEDVGTGGEIIADYSRRRLRSQPAPLYTSRIFLIGVPILFTMPAFT